MCITVGVRAFGEEGSCAEYSMLFCAIGGVLLQNCTAYNAKILRISTSP